MSLLAGLLGFGAGAAQSLAETKKEEMAMERQANLARLSAQYKTGIENARIDQTSDLIAKARQGDPEAQNRLRAQKISWQDEPPSQPNEIKLAEFLFPGDVEAQRRYIQEQNQDSSTASGGLERFSDPVSGLDFYVDIANGKAFVFRAGQFEEVSGSNMAEIISMATVSTQSPTSLPTEPAPRPPASIARPDLEEAQASQPPPQPISRATAMQMESGINQNLSLLEQTLGIKLNEQELFDYSSNLAGPIDRTLGFASRLNLVGHVIDFIGAGDKAEQIRQATNASQFLARQMTLAFTHNPEGRQNIEDIKIGKRLLAGTGQGLMGVITRDRTAYTSLLQVRDQLVKMINTESGIYNSLGAPKQSREKSGAFLSNVAPIMPVLDAYIGGYLVSNTGATPPGQETPKPVVEWTASDFANLYAMPVEEKKTRYDSNQMLALQIWGRDLQRRQAR